MNPRLLPAGDSAIVFEISDTISDRVNERVIALAALIEARALPGVREVVPTYRSLLVNYDPGIVRGAALGQVLLDLFAGLDPGAVPVRRITVPCVYGGAVGMDLDDLAAMKGMTGDEVAAMHAGAEYRVHMIGFAPGFAYLGGLPEPLHTPRLSEPRQHIPAGALGIGGRQASINSVAGPSGWRFLGWTPVKGFNPQSEHPFTFRAGDRIRFRPVTMAEARQLEARQSAGETIVEVEPPATPPQS